MDLCDINYREEALKAAREHAKITGRSIATIGNLVAKDRNFFLNLENGSGCTVDKFQSVMRWFKENTPKTKSKS